MAGSYGRDSAIRTSFGESIRHLAKSYYPYIYSDCRNISKSVVDLQAAFEVCSESLDEFERISNEISSLGYAIFGIQQALTRAITELNIIREEVSDLMNALRTSEKFNLRLLEQLSAIEDNIQTGIESGQNMLTANKATMAAISASPENYMIPPSTRVCLESIIDAGKPTSSNGSGSDSLLKDKLSPDIMRLNWLTQIQKELAHRHSEFSFLTVSLWSEQVRDNFHLVTRKGKLFSGGTKTSYDRKDGKVSEEDSLLRLASSARIDDLPSVVQNIQGRVFEIGGIIVDELNRLRSAYDDTRLQHRSLNMELSDRRRQLIDSLLATHSAVQTLLDLDERNDALVGKLVKTRPLFADLYRVVQSGNVDDMRSQSQHQSLQDVLGPQNWKSFVEKVGKLSVHNNL